MILVDLGLGDSKINLWVDWEALFSVEGSYYISRTMTVNNENAYHSRHQASGLPGVLLLLKVELVMHAGSHFFTLPAAISSPLSSGTT